MQHFNNGPCKNAEFSCRIIQTIDKPARINGDKGPLDPETSRFRRKKEDDWIRKLQTLYPYGLNNRMGKNSDQREDNPVKVLLQPRRRRRKRKRRFRPKKETVKAEDIYVEITGNFTNMDISMDTDAINSSIVSARKKIPQMKKKEVRRLGKIALDDIGGDNFIPRRILHVIVDLTKSKLQDNKIKKNTPSKPRMDILAFTVGYKNHGVGMINMRSIIRKKKLLDIVLIYGL